MVCGFKTSNPTFSNKVTPHSLSQTIPPTGDLVFKQWAYESKWLWFIMPIVILTSSIVNREMDYWACPWEITLIKLTDIWRSILIVDEVISWKGILACRKQKRGQAGVSCSLLTGEVLWPTVFASICLGFLSMMHYTLNCELKQTFLSFSWLCLDILSQQQEGYWDNHQNVTSFSIFIWQNTPFWASSRSPMGEWVNQTSKIFFL